MIYCKIENGIVVDRVIFSEEGMPSDWPNASSFVQHDEAQIGWSYAGGVFEPPAPVLSPPTDEPLVLAQIACARLQVTDGDVTGIERSAGIAGAFMADTDTAWVFFEVEQPDTNYILMPPDDFAKFTDHVEVTRPGLSDLSFLVFRVQ